MRGVVVVMCLVACGDNGKGAPDAAPSNPPTKFAYLNFEGVTLQMGNIDPTTNTWPSEARTYAPFLVGHPDRDEIIDGIVAQTREILAPYDIGVESERPIEKYMMIVVTGPAAENGASPDNGGDAAVQCGLSGYSQVISTQFQVPDVSSVTAQQLIHLHSFLSVAEIALGHGIVNVTLPGNCMCWAAPECFDFDYLAAKCTIEGTATIDPNAVCPHAQPTIDVGAEFLAKLKPHP
jgi:hypothetical protein